jgi:predicted RecA/RadA family phage recombinase
MTIPPSLAQPSVSQAPLDEIEVDLIKFDTTANETVGEGELAWNDTDGTLDLGMKGGNVTQQIGLEQYIRAKHASNAGLTNGVVYYVSGASGGNKEVLPAQADSPSTCKTTIGVATETVTGGSKGFITTFGLVRGLPDAQFTNVTEGTVVYLSATTAGAFTSTPPAAPEHRVVVGFCVRKQSNNNELFVSVQSGYDVDELCDVDASTPASGDVLTYDGSVWKNEIPSTPGGAARPLLTDGAYLDGTNGLVLGGITGNYASTPDSAALSITGDIDIKAKVTMTDWTPAGTSAIVGKWTTTGDQRSYSLRILTGGQIALNTSSTGAGAQDVAGTSTVATGFADGATKWVRATLDVDNGSSQRVYKFYTSDDGTTWTQLGTTVTTAGTISIFDGTGVLEIGSVAVGTGFLLTGTVHEAIVQDAFDTADNTSNLVFDADFASQTADALAFTEDSTNAATVTINTTRYSYGLPGHDFSSTSTSSFGTNVDQFFPFVVSQAIEVDMIVSEVTTAPASSATLFYGVYSADSNFQPTGTPVINTSQTVGASATGIFRRQITPVTLQPGAYVLIANPSVSMAFRFFRSLYGKLNNTFGTSPYIQNLSVSRTAASFPSTPVAWNTLAANNVGIAVYAVLRWKAA